MPTQTDLPTPAVAAEAIPARTGRLPLSWRLPLTISAIIAAALASFLWLADRRVEMTLIRAGSDRARAAAGQVANLIETGPRRAAVELRRVANAPEVRDALADPGDDSRTAAERVIALIPGGGPRRIELWTASGRRVASIGRAGAEAAATSLPESRWPITPGVSGFSSENDRLYYDHVEAVLEPSTGVRLGYLLMRSMISINPPGTLGRLVGEDARVWFGSEPPGIWTDLTREIPPPDLNVLRNSVGQFDAGNGARRLAAVAPVEDTPWLVWVDFPTAPMLAPAATFFRPMAIVGAMVVLSAALLVRIVTRRLTTPLQSLTEAAGAIASGDYARRVPPGNARNELFGLSQSFNAMASHVETSYQSLESRVNERTSALQALRLSEARYRAIIDVALDSIITIDTNGLVIEFNPAAERTFGLKRSQAVGRELAELIVPPVQRAAHRAGMERFMTTGETRVIGRMIEMTAMRADGAEFPVELAITTIDLPGRERLFTGVVRDITLRKRAEAALIESERAFRSTFDEAPLGIAQISVDGRWLRVNARVTGLLGYEAQDLIGTLFANVFAPEQPGAGGDGWSTVLESAASGVTEERRGRRKDGQFVWVGLTVSAHVDDIGVPLYFIVIMEDTSERRRLEERLRQSQKMEAIGRLAGGVAHDFNNLLTAILGYSHLLADEFPPDDQRRRDVEEIIRAAERSASLTRQLLAFSRKQVLQPTTVNMNVLVTDTAEMLRRVIGEHIQLETSLAADLKPVTADPTQLEQVVMNLAVNARDAMPEGGRLSIETENVLLDNTSPAHPVAVAPGHYVMLAVRDTGVGMDEETRNRLFEPFFTTKEQGRGTGLGLATVYGIVKQSGGYIWVNSEPYKGATFQVYFPVAAADISAATRTAAPTLEHGGSETILLVEDERAVRILARVMLERAGYRVLDCATPDEAYQTFDSRGDSVDLLITDIIMPGANGPALYQRLALARPNLPVLFMSGYTDTEIVNAGPIDPGVNFIEKPFTSARLTQKVREVLDRLSA